MKYFDFIVQTVLLVGTLFLAVTFGGSGILLGQFFLGVVQMLSSILSVITNSPFHKKKLIHLVCAVTYLALLAVMVANKILGDTPLGLAMLMAPAWALAIYYYAITWTWAFAQTERGKFLPNISF
ncbi:MAG TPA: hypothetical protein VGD65_05045 [Chryseosolibacter sp.]